MMIDGSTPTARQHHALAFLGALGLLGFCGGCYGNEACEDAYTKLCEKACACGPDCAQVNSDGSPFVTYASFDECFEQAGNCNSDDNSDAGYEACGDDVDAVECTEVGGNPVGVEFPATCK